MILSIAEMALGFSANTCFGLMSGEWGQKNQGKLGAGSIAFGVASLVVGIFANAQRQTPPPAVTQAQMQDALDALRAQIADDAFLLTLDAQSSSTRALVTEYTNAYSDVLVDLKSRDTNDPEVDAILNKDWDAYYDGFKAEVNNSTRIMPLLAFITPLDNRKYQTLDVYLMAAGLYLNLCQFCLIVEWNKIQNDPKYEDSYITQMRQYEKEFKVYKKDLADWQSRYNAAARYAYNLNNPGFGPTHRVGIISNPTGPVDVGPKPKPPTRPKTPPEMFSELMTSPFAKAIQDNVQAFIDYADPIVSDLEHRISKRDATQTTLFDLEISDNTAAFKPTYGSNLGHSSPPRGTPEAQVVNSTTGLALTPQSRLVAEGQIKWLKGIERAGLAHQGFADLREITADKVATFRKTIKNWQETQTSYAKPKA